MMAPRNNDGNANYKKKNFPVDDSEVDVNNIVPCLLHKKHKVVKLVKSQLQRIHEGGLLCDIERMDEESEEERSKRKSSRRCCSESPGTSKDVKMMMLREGEEVHMNRRNETTGCRCLILYLLAFLLAMFLLIFLAVWISAGPLSNYMAHTPVPPGSFVRTDGLCSLEKKYLLRWSKPFE